MVGTGSGVGPDQAHRPGGRTGDTSGSNPGTIEDSDCSVFVSYCLTVPITYNPFDSKCLQSVYVVPTGQTSPVHPFPSEGPPPDDTRVRDRPEVEPLSDSNPGGMSRGRRRRQRRSKSKPVLFPQGLESPTPLLFSMEHTRRHTETSAVYIQSRA